MTVTRHPTGQDLMCLVCLKPAQDIDHVVNRGSGGSKERDVPENKVPLCRECHELKTQGYINTEIKWAADGRVYRWQRRLFKDNEGSLPWIVVPVEVSQRYKCLVLSEASNGQESPRPAASSEEGSGDAEGVAGTQQASKAAEEEAPVMSDDALCPHVGPVLSTKEESDEKARDTGRGPDIDSREHLRGVRGSQLTHEQRVAVAKAIKDTEWNRQWFAGDTGNLWIEQLGESAEQYLYDFGYVHESLANILRVCAAIKPAFRYGTLRFSHHVVVYDQPPEVRMDWLAECELNGWSVAEFRRQVKGSKPRVKRYSVEELREKRQEWWPSLGRVTNTLIAFLDWLEGA